MKLDESIKLITALTELLEVIVWPLLLLVIFYTLRGNIRNILSNLSEFSLKAGSIETSLKRTQINVAAELGRAAEDRQQVITTDAIYDVTSKITPGLVEAAGNSTVLWVDDNQKHHSWEQSSLKRLKINIVSAQSTQEALEIIERNHIDVIISDMNRPPDGKAGITLLEKLFSRKSKIPIIIYGGSRNEKEAEEATKLNAFGYTNRPDELIRFVLSALSPSQDRAKRITM